MGKLKSQKGIKIIVILVLTVGCSTPSGRSSGESKEVTGSSASVVYQKSMCVDYGEVLLSSKQKKLQGRAGFGGVTDFGVSFGEEFNEKALLYFKKGSQTYSCLVNEEIDDQELLNAVKAVGMHLVVTTDLKIAKVFDVPLNHLPAGGWEIAENYLFVIRKGRIYQVYENICEDQVISLISGAVIR